MMEITETPTSESHVNNVQNYYHFHAPIYDATRWGFLFGRKAVLDMIPNLPPHPDILEIGCGTGYNIRQLRSYFPDAQILGVDLSSDMLKVARNKVDQSDRVELRKAKYGPDITCRNSFDLILLSYSLTMMNEQYEDLIHHITDDLNPEGYLAVVDFHSSSFGWFRRWMNMNHVDFNGNLLLQLQQYFNSVESEINRAYGGLWSYIKFVGKARKVEINRSEK